MLIAILLTIFFFFTAYGTNVESQIDPEVDVVEQNLSDAVPEEEDYDHAGEDINIDEMATPTYNSPLEREVNNFIEAYRDDIKGLSLRVFSLDDMILEIDYGYANTRTELAVCEETVWGWGSVTKLLVWVSAFQLYERGELDLHADIFTYINGEYFLGIVYPVTMHHLINHTSGLAGHAVDMALMDEDIPTLEEVLKNAYGEEIGIHAQHSRPGENFFYSNFGTAMAAYVVQQASGLPFYEYVHENIFMPLGMYQTALLPDLSDNMWVDSQRDNMQTYSATGGIALNRRQDIIYPAGGAVGTISDMVKFGRALFSNGNGAYALFENPKTLYSIYPSWEEILNIPHSPMDMGGVFISFFNGFVVTVPYGNDNVVPSRVIGHSGAFNGSFTYFFINIDEGIGMIVNENRFGGMLMSSDDFFSFFINEIPRLALGVEDYD